MVRYENVMYPLSRNLPTDEFVGFDVETYSNKNLFLCGSIVYRKDGEITSEFFTDKMEMCKRLLHRDWASHRIVATNLDFDFTVLFYDTEYWNKFKFCHRGGKMILCVYNLGSKHGKVRFVDTMSYMPASVERLGKILGIEKMEHPSFLGQIPRDVSEWEYMKLYNIKDSEISFRFAEFLSKGIETAGGRMRNTIAASAMDTFRRSFQSRPISKEHNYVQNIEELREMIFSAYYGGRTEVFERGTINKKLMCYDVNSLYPYCMRREYPTPETVEIINKEKLSVDNINKYGVTKCVVNVPYMKYPILPIRKSGKLIFPIGTFEGVWINYELKYAIDCGVEIKSISYQAVYHESEEIFKDYVDYMYNQRMNYKAQKNEIEHVFKLLMNSLYGKFGMRKTEKFTIKKMKNLSLFELDKMGKAGFKMKNGVMYANTEKQFDGIYSFPIFAAYTTAYARVHLHKLIVSSNSIYVDTDSIYTETQMEISNELGGLKLEGTDTDAVFIRPKLYRFSDKIKMKGNMSGTTEDFTKILEGFPIIKNKFVKLKESIVRELEINEIIEISKSISLDDDKRVWPGKFTLEHQISEPQKLEVEK